MKKVLITGIGGFVGHHLANQLLSHSDYVIAGTYRSDASISEFTEKQDRIILHRLDLLNAEAVKETIALVKPDYLVHLAASASAAKSYNNAQETLTNNIVSQLNILDALKLLSLQQTRLLVISSGEIYGAIEQSDLPVSEKTPLRPVSPYAVSKISQDYLAYQYHLAYKQDVVRLRPFNHTGPGQKAGFVVADFAKQLIEIEKGKKEPVIEVGNLEAKRDFTDVRDMVKAYHLAMDKGVSGEVYNLGSGKSIKVADILSMLVTMTNASVEVKKDPNRFRPLDVPEIVCDTNKFTSITQWKPEIPLKQTLQDILDYWRKIV